MGHAEPHSATHGGPAAPPPPPPPAAPAERADKPPLPLSASVWAPRGRRKLQVRARAQLQGPGPTLHPDPTPPHPGADSSGSRELGRGSQWTIRTLANFENTGLRPAMGGKFGVLPAVGVQGFRHYGPMRTRPGLVGGTVPRDWHERGGGETPPQAPLHRSQPLRGGGSPTPAGWRAHVWLTHGGVRLSHEKGPSASVSRGRPLGVVTKSDKPDAEGCLPEGAAHPTAHLPRGNAETGSGWALPGAGSRAGCSAGRRERSGISGDGHIMS